MAAWRRSASRVTNAMGALQPGAGELRAGLLDHGPGALQLLLGVLAAAQQLGHGGAHPDGVGGEQRRAQGLGRFAATPGMVERFLAAAEVGQDGHQHVAPHHLRTPVADALRHLDRALAVGHGGGIVEAKNW